MTITDYGKEAADARLVVTGMIVSSQVLGAVAQKWPSDGEGLFDSDSLDRVAGWCVRHFRKHGRAPGPMIRSYGRRWAETRRRPTEESKAVDELLAGLSDDYLRREAKSVQPDYITQVATDYFTAVRVRRAADDAKDLVAKGNPTKALEVLNRAGKLDLTDEDMIDVLEDKHALRTAFTEASEPVVVYPGAAGEFFGHRLKRRAFVGFEGPEKRGKSFWILDVAWRAVSQGRRVAYFELGDLPREEVIMRIAARALNCPIDPAELDADGKYQYPISFQLTDGKGDVVHKEKVLKEKVPWQVAWKGFQRRAAEYGSGLFKLGCHPARSMSVQGMVAKLERLRDVDRWVPDVVCCDYADIMAPVNGTADTRDQINLTWTLLRSLAMSWNCLVVTATQANRGSYNAEIIDMEHTGEDKRKLAHTTLMIGINQTEEEKDFGIYRLNKVVARTGKYDKRKCLHTAACLAVSNPCVRSAM